jgi:hypothetical protein
VCCRNVNSKMLLILPLLNKQLIAFHKCLTNYTLVVRVHLPRGRASVMEKFSTLFFSLNITPLIKNYTDSERTQRDLSIYVIKSMTYACARCPFCLLHKSHSADMYSPIQRLLISTVCTIYVLNLSGTDLRSEKKLNCSNS